MRKTEAKKPHNLFTDMDKILLHKAIINVLAPEEIDLIVLLYWKNMLLHEIAEETSISIGALQKTLDSAFQKLKSYCTTQQGFSRSIVPASLVA